MLTRRALAFFAPAVIVCQYPLPAIYAFEVYHVSTSFLESQVSLKKPGKTLCKALSKLVV